MRNNVKLMRIARQNAVSAERRKHWAVEDLRTNHLHDAYEGSLEALKQLAFYQFNTGEITYDVLTQKLRWLAVITP